MSIGLLFPGQGAQSVGMGAELTARSRVACELFELASQTLGFDLLKLCTEGPAEQLNRTEFSQPALFVHALAALRLLEEERPELWTDVAAVAGLSLGEYTAVCAAGGISFEAGVRLVQLRGRAMQAAADAVSSGMSSILGLEQDALATICQQATNDCPATADPVTQGGSPMVRVANLLCPGNIAISGHIAALQIAEELSIQAGAFKTVRLQVAGAFHTPVMQPAVQKLSEALKTVEFQTTRVPIYSNVDAAPHSQPDEFRRLLSQQVVEPVQWQASLESMIAAGCERFIEVGSGRVLSGTLKRINRKIACENIGD